MPPDHLMAKRPQPYPAMGEHALDCGCSGCAPKPDHSDAYVCGFSDGLDQAARDISITHAHRTALRRILAGDPIGDCGHLLGALYLHELVDDDMVHHLPFVTPLGRELLAAHDRLAETVRRERPRLTSRPAPARWALVDGMYMRDSGGTVEHVDLDADELNEARAYACDLVALVDWIVHQRAVSAQDGAS